MSSPAQADWFQQNAPPAPAQEQAGGDWFASNAPNVGVPTDENDPLKTGAGMEHPYDPTNQQAAEQMHGAVSLMGRPASSVATDRRFESDLTSPAPVPKTIDEALGGTKPQVPAGMEAVAEDAEKVPAIAQALAAVPAAGEALASAGAKVGAAIPSAERAGQAFEEVKGVAGRIPIDINGPEKVALETQRLSQSGGQMPKVMRDWLKRTEHLTEPVTYEEGRNFASNASRLSSDEYTKLTPVMKRQAALFAQSLNESVSGAAKEAGVASKLEGAMKEYHQAKQMENRVDMVRDLVKQGIKGGLKYGTALYLAHRIWEGE